MSDHSSESSCEWVILDENDDLSLNDAEEPLNLQLSYEAVCDAVSESIKSSLSGEELEWQYELFQDYIPQYATSSVQELDYLELDTDSSDGLDVIHAEDYDTNKCASTSEFEDDKNIDIASVSKIQCYKHHRNDQVNFVLNLMLALVIASAIGLGIGHFLGWSHKCYKGTAKPKATIFSTISDAAIHSTNPSQVVVVKQIAESFVYKEEESISPLPFSENLSDISCWNSKDGSSSGPQEVCESHANDLIDEAGFSETSSEMSKDSLEFQKGDVNQNISDTGLSHVSNIVTHIDWNNVALIAEPLKDLNEHLERSSLKEIFSTDTEKSVTEGISPFGNKAISSIDTEVSVVEEISSFGSKEIPSIVAEKSKPGDVPAFGIGDSKVYKSTVNDDKFDLHKQIYIKNQNFSQENNLTKQLRQDISQVIQSLSALALAHLTHVSDNYPLFIENSEKIIKYYHDFENLVNSKLVEIDSFVLSAEYKKYDRISLKHLQKKVYCLIDSVDYLMKISIKTLTKNNKKIDVDKFSKNISKVIFNFNKRWEKNNLYWTQTISKLKFQDTRAKYFKKENKHWKKKGPIENEHRNNKYKRYSLKS